MQRDIRHSPLYLEAEALHESLRRPGEGAISDAADPSTDGKYAVYAGTIVEDLNGLPCTRLCLTELSSGVTCPITFGPNSDQHPRFSPDGKYIAFLSDRHTAGDPQLFLFDLETGTTRATPPVDGWVEYIHWSPGATQILLGVAGRGADVAAITGAIASKQGNLALPSWMPLVRTGSELCQWRRAWVYDLNANSTRPIGPECMNVWEATWCGKDAIAAVTSSEPTEGHWYGARLHVIDIHSGKSREVHVPQAQIGLPAASPAGLRLAVVEAACSDRGVVAGDVVLLELRRGTAARVDTEGVDVTYTNWRSETTLLLAGHRGFESVIGTYNIHSGQFVQAWRSREITASGRYMAVAGIDDSADCVLIGEGFRRAPELAVIRRGRYQVVKTFDHAYADHCSTIGGEQRLVWSSPDDLAIQGHLLTPAHKGPHPLIMYIHGGPVGHWRPTWLGRFGVHILMLLKRGYAVFFPNPRGSSARGQQFARMVFGDMGGADARDLLSGIDALVRRKVADPTRLGIIGGSYGGFMTAWLVTQDTRFAAAVSVAPHTNQVSTHLCSNIPHFMTLLAGDHYTNPTGKYFERSPIMHVRKARTPTLIVCGLLDRCTPPEEALQFYSALMENKVRAALVSYPEEGHGIRRFPAVIDYAARVVDWFEQNMRA